MINQWKTSTLCKVSEYLFEDICILDIGCGRGEYWLDAFKFFKVKEITGVDLCSDEPDITFTKTFDEIRHVTEGFNSAYKLVTMDANQFLETTIEKYHLIVCFQFISLFGKSQAQNLLFKLRYHLKTGGFIAICIPNEKFTIHQKPPDFAFEVYRNKFNLNNSEFKDFVQGFELLSHEKDDFYHWAILQLQ